MKELIKLKVIGEAGYGRPVEVGVWIDNCDKCKEEAPLICIDTSQGEYGFGGICKSCIISLFIEAEEKHEGSKILSSDL